MFNNLFFKYDDFFDGDDDELLFLTQVVENETEIAQYNNKVKSPPLQAFNAQQHNIKIELKPTISVPNNNIVKTNRKAVTTTRQTKISNILGPSTSKSSSSSLISAVSHQNDKPVNASSTAVKQTLGKRIASSPLHTDKKRPSVEPYRPEDIWDDINMDVDDSNPLIKVLKCTPVYKNSKIQVKQNEWVCSGTVIDENKHVEVEFSSKVSGTHFICIYNIIRLCAPFVYIQLYFRYWNV